MDDETNPIVLAEAGEQIVFPMPQAAQPDPTFGFVVPPNPADHVPMPVADAQAFDDMQQRKIDDAFEKLRVEESLEEPEDTVVSEPETTESNDENDTDTDDADAVSSDDTEPTPEPEIRRSWLGSGRD